jgi:hypothetical protein
MKRTLFVLVCLFTFFNSQSQSINVDSALKNFKGYKVAVNAKQLGTEYWENTNVLSDLIICVFQKNYEVFAPPQGEAYCAWTQSICNGDFNNDGYIDVFNSGTAFGGKKANLSFLIWNPANLKFEEKNLINDKTSFVGAPTKVSPIYLNDDNFVDLVIFGHQDESSPKNRIEPITVCISDGKGGYDLTELVLQPPLPNENVVYEHGSVADLNGDKLPDLFIAANSHSYIFWGIAAFPYFSNKDFVDMKTDLSFYTNLKDINKDGYNDIFIANNIQNKMLINNGKGVFYGKEINTPYPTSSTNTMNVYDYIVDDLNGDGLNDFININATNHLNWTIEAYIQQANGSFNRELSWIEYTLSLNRTNYRNKLIYYDFDGDGKKDITYSDTGMDPYTNPNNEIKKKTVFIRTGNKFIEKDFFQFDPYAKYLFDSLRGKPNCPLSYMTKPIFSQSNLSFCLGDSTKISINNPRDTLKWYYGTQSDLTNVTSKTFLESTKLYVTRTDTFKCVISSDTISITKNALPTTPIVKDTIFCQNISSSILLASGTGGNTLKWYGINATGGIGSSDAILASTLDTITKAYYVSQINNTTGCESPRSKITVKINPAPVNPIVRDTAYCLNVNVDSLKSTPLTGHNLIWYGSNATGGVGTNTATKPNTSNIGSLNYYISQVNTATGCESPRAKIAVVINSLPVAPSIKDTSYCNNVNADTIRVNAISGTKLLWYGTNATGGVGSATPIKPNTSTVGTLNYYVSHAVTATGCEGPRSKIVVTIIPSPSTPSIAWNGTQFTATTTSTGVNYQWLLSNSSVSGATSATYKPTAIGSYKIQITDANGCKNVSDSFSLVVTAVNPSIETSTDHIAKIAPNPASTDVTLYFQQKPTKTLTIRLLNLKGQVLKQITTNSQSTRITLSEILAGNYIIEIIGKGYNQTQQLLITK